MFATTVPVHLRDIHKSFGAVDVIRGVDLSIAAGEFVALVGPSGCGKSTLLRMVAGLEDISRGEIVIGDRVVNALAPKERDVAMVFQSYALYPQKTVSDNMAFGLRMRRAPSEVIVERVGAAASMLGLTTLLDRLPKQLSGGQRQRVAMGRAMVRAPKVFLFDEPLSNLDAKLRVQMRTEIKARHHKLATTTIYVTHDQVEAMTLADRIVVLNGGVVEQVGTPLELYQEPVNAFVATFIGSPAMNLLPAVLRRNGREAWAETEDGVRLPVPQPAPQAAEGSRILYGVRPEHFRLADDGIPLAVEVVEPTGADTQIFVRLGGILIGAIFREIGGLGLRPGSRVALRPVAEAVRLFDEATGLRLR